jgi:penicillin-binding protein 1C
LSFHQALMNRNSGESLEHRDPRKRRLRTWLYILGSAITFVFVFFVMLRILPYAGDQALKDLSFSQLITDRYGSEMAVLPVNDEGLRRLYLPLSALPRELIHIVLAAEDSRYYFHPGVDLPSLLRAAWNYLGGGGSRFGASTISMQLSSILHPRPPTLSGKLREMLDAMQLEQRLSKAELLELYISMVPMGFNVEGYPAAARRFFGRGLDQLAPMEMAILAAIPRSPRSFNPLENPAEAHRAAEVILEAAGLEEFYLPREQLGYQPEPVWPNEAPHFVNFLIQEDIREYSSGRFPLVTSLDLEFQHELESVLSISVENAADFRISNAAALFVNPASGEILAYAGSVDFFDAAASGQIDGVQMKRQPGSTLKPFLAALALENGFSLSSILPDIPLSFGTSGVYVPRNFNEQYNGPVRLRQALSSSLNIPAVYLLGRLSVEQFTDALIRAGFGSLEQQRGSLGVSLALGGAEVSLFELLGGYLSFYSDGSRPQLTALLSPPQDVQRNTESGPVSRYPAPPELPRLTVWEPSTAALIRSVLTDNDERIMTFGRASPLKYDFPVMVKTGTSNQFNNIWAVGIAEDIAGAVWMGNFSGETVQAAPGSSLPAAALKSVIESRAEGNDFPDAGNLREVRICSLSGMLATDSCPHQITELYAPNSRPLPCDWHEPFGNAARYPQIFGFWADDYGYDIRLQKNGPAEIFGISDGGRYFLDPRLPRSNQQSVVYFTGTSPGTISLDGQDIYRGGLPVRLAMDMLPGTHYLELQSSSGTVSVRFEVIP